MKKIIGILAFAVISMVTVACGSSMPTSAPINSPTSVNQEGQGSINGAITPTAVMPTTTEIRATPTLSIPPLEILSSQSYINARGEYLIVGEVRNNASVPMNYHENTATLYDDKGNIAGTVPVYVLPGTIPPGGKSPFMTTPTDQYAGTTNYKLQFPGGHQAPLEKQDLVISGDSSSVKSGWLVAEGEVQNTGTTQEDVIITVTLYDASGNVVGVAESYPDPSTVPGGGSAPFEAIIDLGQEDHLTTYDHYEIQAYGYANNLPPTPTLSVPSLEILSSQGYIEDSIPPKYIIIGEVRNNTSVPLLIDKFTATLYDDNGNITGNDSAQTLLQVIPPGGKSPFSTLGTDEYAGTTNYKLQVDRQHETTVLGRQDLVISGDSSEEVWGILNVSGEVRNTGTSPAENVRIIVTVYDASGNVVGVSWSGTDPSTVPGGGSAHFDAGTTHHPNFDHYEIQATVFLTTIPYKP